MVNLSLNRNYFQKFRNASYKIATDAGKLYFGALTKIANLTEMELDEKCHFPALPTNFVNIDEEEGNENNDKIDTEGNIEPINEVDGNTSDGDEVNVIQQNDEKDVSVSDNSDNSDDDDDDKENKQNDEDSDSNTKYQWW